MPPTFSSKTAHPGLKIAVFLLIALVVGLNQYLRKDQPSSSDTSQLGPVAAFHQQLTDVQIGGSGNIVALFKDDLKGSRHQRFLLKVAPDQTLLVNHNIDLAPRIDGLRKGDKVVFYGEYVWNEKGGLIHWTHHDPAGRHPDGWLKHNGKIYQ